MPGWIMWNTLLAFQGLRYNNNNRLYVMLIHKHFQQWNEIRSFTMHSRVCCQLSWEALNTRSCLPQCIGVPQPDGPIMWTCYQYRKIRMAKHRANILCMSFKCFNDISCLAVPDLTQQEVHCFNIHDHVETMILEWCHTSAHNPWPTIM